MHAEQTGIRASRRAPLVVFEGIEGSGKSTQIACLSAFLDSAGHAFLVTREPGGTPLGESLRELMLRPSDADLDGLTELFLLEASRRQLTRQVVVPALERGTLVVCDRFADSSVAYQGGGRGLRIEMVEQLNAIATGGLVADLTILLDLPAESGLARVARRPGGEDRLEREQLAFHRRVRQAYLDLATRRGAAYHVLEAVRPVEEISAEVIRSVQRLL